MPPKFFEPSCQIRDHALDVFHHFLLLYSLRAECHALWMSCTMDAIGLQVRC